MKKIFSSLYTLFLLSFVFSFLILVISIWVRGKIGNMAIVLPVVDLSEVIKLSRFSLEKAPSNSLTGVLSSIRGDVGYESRIATESANVDTPREVQQGEKITTGPDGSATLKFNNSVEINIGESSILTVIQTLPPNLVFSQSSGVLTYKKTGINTVSVRSFNLLVSVEGTVEIDVDRENLSITIKVEDGGAVLAYNDSNNITRVVKINSGNKIIYNSRTRTTDPKS